MDEDDIDVKDINRNDGGIRDKDDEDERNDEDSKREENERDKYKWEKKINIKIMKEILI